MHKILIVEDDRVIAEQVAKQLSAWGCQTKCIVDFNGVMEEFADFAPDMVLLDISLPFYNGYHWCTQIREISKVPIIFISSTADNMNMVMAMNMGADDFIAKPFDLAVLTAKVQALLRRTYDFAGQAEPGILEHGGAVLNMGDASLMYQGEKIDLTKNEFRILEILMSNKGKVVSRDDIMIKLWETESFVDENTLTVNVARLRKKLEASGLDDFIRTKKGMGYVVE
jgi:DNA-binding response OmpR family regulator